jgi:hypothetical protein
MMVIVRSNLKEFILSIFVLNLPDVRRKTEDQLIDCPYGFPLPSLRGGGKPDFEKALILHGRVLDSQAQKYL